MILFPFIALGLLFVIFYLRSKDASASFFRVSIVWGTLLVFLSELLSIFHALDRARLILGWSLINTILLGFLFSSIRSIKKIQCLELLKTLKPPRLERFDFLILAVVLFFITVLGMLAVLGAPNSWDAMYYHLTRLFFWKQHQSLSFYPAPSLPQLTHPPFAEMINLHSYLLNGNDRFVNLSQYLSMVGCLLAVYLIAKKLGLSLKGCLFSVVFCLSLPQGVLQSSNAKNDYVASFYFLCSIYFIVLSYRRMNFINTIAFGMAIGLAALTKGTMYFYLTPFLVSFTFISYKQKLLIRNFLLAAPVFLMVNSAHYLRNFLLFGTPLRDDGTADHMNSSLTFPSFLSSFIKNLSLHLQTPSRAINNFIESFVINLHHIINVDINDHRISLHNYNIPDVILHELIAGNPFHTLFLIIGAYFGILHLCRKKFHIFSENGKIICSLAFCTFASFLLFCFFLKWQVVGARLHLPLFVAVAPLAGVFIEYFCSTFYRRLFSILLLSFAMPPLLINYSRPILKRPPQEYKKYLGRLYSSLPKYSVFSSDRGNMYFVDFGMSYREDYEKAAHIVSTQNCKQVAIVSQGPAPLYPLLHFLEQKSPHIQVQHVNLSNETALLSNEAPFKDFKPCLALGLGYAKKVVRIEGKAKGKAFKNIWKSDASLWGVKHYLRIWKP